MLSYYYKQSSNDLTGISRKKSPPHLVSLIKVEGLFSPYIVTNFDIVGLALHVFEAFIEQIKPILLSHTC